MKLKSTAIALGLASLYQLTSSINAQAATFKVPGFGDYDITTVTTSYDANKALLESQPWWGSALAASTFASTVGGSLGFPLGSGPFFRYSGTVFSGTGFASPNFYTYFPFPISSVINGQQSPNISVVYAVATPATSTVPEPSEMLGTLAFGTIGTGYLLKRRSKVA